MEIPVQHSDLIPSCNSFGNQVFAPQSIIVGQNIEFVVGPFWVVSICNGTIEYLPVLLFV